MIAFVSDFVTTPAPGPVVGISGSSADSASVRAMMTQIRSAGGTPLFLCNFANRDPDADLKKIDALVVMGNNDDIDPAKYGAPKDAHTNIETDTARADYEERILFKALAMRMPVLGVCGGLQRMNVLSGGTLHQHVPDLIGNDMHAQQEYNIAPFIPVQRVTMAEGSTLAQLIGSIGALYTPSRQPIPKNVVHENSMHHQAVARVGAGFRAAAFADETLPDGSRVIEAIEADPNGVLKGQCAIGVQWHPEFSASPLGAKLADYFVSKGKEFASAGNRTHPPEEALLENTLSASPQAKNLGRFTRMVNERQQQQQLSQLTR